MFEDPEVPVLEQALEDLLGNNNESSAEMSYSQSEIEEFYRRLGCNAAKLNMTPQVSPDFLFEILIKLIYSKLPAKTFTMDMYLDRLIS